MTTISRLEVARPPSKDGLLMLLDMLREEVERGEVVALFALTVRTGEEFDCTSAGEIRLTTLAGMLGRAHLDALEAMRDRPPGTGRA